MNEFWLKIIGSITGLGGLLYSAFWLGGNKKKKSDNTKGDYDNRADIAEDWLNRLEVISEKAGQYYQDKEDYRMDILKMLRISKEHIETCENPKDDFSEALKAFNKKYDKNV